MWEQVLQEWEVDTAKLVAMAGDGASLNGTMRSLQNVTGNNVAAELRRWVSHPVITVHCAAHRLQLAVSSSYRGELLQELEQVVSTLFVSAPEIAPGRAESFTTLVRNHVRSAFHLTQHGKNALAQPTCSHEETVQVLPCSLGVIVLRIIPTKKAGK